MEPTPLNLKHSLAEDSSLGERLRHAREKRGWSQAEVAAILCLDKKIIAALEEEDLQRLPGEPFNRGYQRAYAQLLKLDLEILPKSTLRPEPAAKSEGRGWMFLGLGSLLARALNYLVVTALILLVVIWWHERYAHQQISTTSVINMTDQQTPFKRLPRLSPDLDLPLAESFLDNNVDYVDQLIMQDFLPLWPEVQYFKESTREPANHRRARHE